MLNVYTTRLFILFALNAHNSVKSAKKLEKEHERCNKRYINKNVIRKLLMGIEYVRVY